MQHIILLCLLFFANPLIANTTYPFESPKQEAQFNHLLKDLRCLVCQNQDLADSHASLAIDLKQKIYHMVQEGKSDSEIYDFLTSRYGDYILFNPPVKFITLFLWTGPFLFLMMGLIIFSRLFYKRAN